MAARSQLDGKNARIGTNSEDQGPLACLLPRLGGWVRGGVLETTFQPITIPQSLARAPREVGVGWGRWWGAPNVDSTNIRRSLHQTRRGQSVTVHTGKQLTKSAQPFALVIDDVSPLALADWARDPLRCHHSLQLFGSFSCLLAAGWLIRVFSLLGSQEP